MKKIKLLLVSVFIVLFGGMLYILYLNITSETPHIATKNTTYICKNNKIISAKFYIQTYPIPTPSKNESLMQPTGSVDVTLNDGRGYHLLETISSSGVRYANKDASFIFWIKGTQAIILENNAKSTYKDCEEKIYSKTNEATSTKKYLYKGDGFSIILPHFTLPPTPSQTNSFTVDENYSYGLIPGEIITGVKFIIPLALTQGTNLSKDTYLSVENIMNTKKCTADMFLANSSSYVTQTEKELTYSVASSTDAGAGNRYEEIVYATPGKNKCLAVRYFIHYTVISNYPAGTRKEFDKKVLENMFTTIRKTITIEK